MSPPPASILDTLRAAWPPESWRDVPVLVAVSGGPDSVALLRLLLEIRRPGPGAVIAAHFNHRLRGAEADQDETFVGQLCRELEVPCHVGHPDAELRAQSTGQGLEATARTARYRFFRETADRLGARFLATGHTADDQAETILHHVLRGTGVAGLAGMRPLRRLSYATTLVRPMLGIRRDAVLDYLHSRGQPYRVDPSNESRQFTRNRIRHELLPQLVEKFNPNAVEALLRLGRLAAEVDEAIVHWVEGLAQRHLKFSERRPPNDTPTCIEIDMTALQGQPRHVVRELILRGWKEAGWPRQAMGYAKWDELAEMGLAAASRSASAPGPRTEPHQEQQHPQARKSGPGKALKRTFPGRVSAEAVAGTLRLRRDC